MRWQRKEQVHSGYVDSRGTIRFAQLLIDGAPGLRANCA